MTGVLVGAAGGAGGIMFIPVLLIFFDFSLYTIPLSRAMALGVVLAYTLMNAFKAPPKGRFSSDFLNFFLYFRWHQVACPSSPGMQLL